MYEFHLTTYLLREELTEFLKIVHTSEDFPQTWFQEMTQCEKHMINLLNWLMTTYLFNFSSNPRTIENINIRLSVDAIHMTNLTRPILRELKVKFKNLNCDFLSAIVSSNNTIKLRLEELKHKLEKSRQLLETLGSLYDSFEQSVRDENLYKYHDHFVPDKNFYR